MGISALNVAFFFKTADRIKQVLSLRNYYDMEIALKGRYILISVAFVVYLIGDFITGTLMEYCTVRSSIERSLFYVQIQFLLAPLRNIDFNLRTINYFEPWEHLAPQYIPLVKIIRQMCFAAYCIVI